MPSHLKPEDPRPSGVSELDVIGNAFADDQAGAAAKRVAVPLNVSTPCIYYYALVRRIQRRLVEILVNMPHRNTGPKKQPLQPVRPPSLDSLMAQSRHVAFVSGTRIMCAVCRNSIPCKGIAARHWLQTFCSQPPGEDSRPVKLHSTIIQIGHLSTHPSHCLHVLHNIIFCTKCGCHAHSRIVNLAKKCIPPGDYGLAQLSKFNKGEIPKNINNRSSVFHPGTRTVTDDPELVLELADFRLRFDAIVRAQGPL